MPIKCRPQKWLLYAPLAALPFLAAWAVNTRPMLLDLTERVTASLAQSSWAKAKLDGRDVKLSGDAPSAEAIGEAVRLAAATSGVRRVESVARVVEPPPPPPAVELAPPTVESLLANTATPSIKGTWAEGVAKTLAVSLAGRTYSLGTAAELTSNAGAWTLKPSIPLADGSYDVSAEIGDGGVAVKSSVPGKIVIDTLAPAAPTIAPVSALPGKIEASGTWAESDASSFTAQLAGKSWSFGSDAALSSDGKGHWRLKPDVELAPGTYDLAIELRDAAGNVARDATRDEIVIAAPPEPEPAPPPPEPAPPPPPAMSAPTVIALAATVARPAISGTWPQPAATSLSVSLAGVTYVLGTGEALTSATAGAWSLTVPRPLKDGVYDVAVEAADASGNKAADTTKDELTVDAAGPATPTVKLYAGEASPENIAGTWDAGAAKSLKVSIAKAGIAAALGSDPALASQGGVWMLTLPRALEAGSYDVAVETADALGRIATDQTKFEILVKEAAPPPAPPPPPPPAPPYDCAGALDKIGGVFPIRFDFDETALKSPYDLSVNQVAALLKDARCSETKAMVTGHADYLGPHLYNQALSEKRAQVVVDMLAAAGVSPARLSVQGKSSADPLDPGKGDAPRARNRRVVIRIVQ